ncbi:MAG: tRNA dihydrouridine synthase DusB [Alphaproteobacteria bacterium]|nr:tRNA dihydrouridine synthase DusB [Alphaproteobacteria bacterium]
MLDIVNSSAVCVRRLKPIRLGAVTIDVPVMLAPMAGVTDRPFRRLVKKHGAGLMFSEMIASQAMVREVRKTLQMVQGGGDEQPLAVQLAGCEPDVMADAAKLNEDRGAPIIDINFGCPVKKIVKGDAGSSLMRNEKLAARILEAVVKAVRVPVTLKMRLGWSHENLNAPRLAKIAEACGIQMVTVHGRTRNQFYSGQADWAAIRGVKDAVNIPVIANGDITCGASALEALERSGADGVMIGRGAYGRPWLLRQVMDFLQTGKAAEHPSPSTLYTALLAHFEDMLAHYGEEAGLRIARKHMGWYSKGLPGSSGFRAAVNVCGDAGKVRELIHAFFQPLMEQTV